MQALSANSQHNFSVTKGRRKGKRALRGARFPKLAGRGHVYFKSTIFFVSLYVPAVMRQKYVPLATALPDSSCPFHKIA